MDGLSSIETDNGCYLAQARCCPEVFDIEPVIEPVIENITKQSLKQDKIKDMIIDIEFKEIESDEVKKVKRKVKDVNFSTKINNVCSKDLHPKEDELKINKEEI